MNRKPVQLVWLVLLILPVVTLPGHSAAQAGFTSAYTDLNTQCRYGRAAAEGSDAPLYCAGYGDYRLLVSFSALAADVFVESRDRRFSRLVVSGQAPNYAEQKGRRVEWRLAGGEPFAVIARAFEYAEGADGAPDFSWKTGEKLIVKGLEGYDHIDFTLDARTPNANARARQLADDNHHR
ncbi:MAG: hypothetical protein NZ585_13420 [Chloracidobacterium sp.]|nr:hypothetical protein [Chloracidobacterium sp.]MDW8218837.1 hypothetical protein [Acidobacteriota bacterium]